MIVTLLTSPIIGTRLLCVCLTSFEFVWPCLSHPFQSRQTAGAEHTAAAVAAAVASATAAAAAHLSEREAHWASASDASEQRHTAALQALRDAHVAELHAAMNEAEQLIRVSDNDLTRVRSELASSAELLRAADGDAGRARAELAVAVQTVAQLRSTIAQVRLGAWQCVSYLRNMVGFSLGLVRVLVLCTHTVSHRFRVRLDSSNLTPARRSSAPRATPPQPTRPRR